MAQKVVLVDDIDGSEAAMTIEFLWKGDLYQIDLSTSNYLDYSLAMEKLVEKGRLVERAKGKRRSSPSKHSTPEEIEDRKARRQEDKKIREWARAGGWDVKPRGVIPASIRDAYTAAHRRKSA